MTERPNDYKTCLDNIYLVQELEHTVKSITGDEHNSRLYLDEKLNNIVEDLKVNVTYVRQIRDSRLQRKVDG